MSVLTLFYICAPVTAIITALVAYGNIYITSMSYG